MHDVPVTRPTLLLRLQSGHDRQAWDMFVEIYAPLVFRLARRRGLQDADAADVTQDVLLRAAESFRRQKYDPSRGSFRGWLFTIARNAVFDRLDELRSRERPTGGTTAQHSLDRLPGADETAAWRDDYRRRLFTWAADRVRGEVRPTTWEAFWRTAMEDQAGEAVAQALGLSVAAVYLAKARVLKRIRETVAQLDHDAEDEQDGLRPTGEEQNHD